MTATSLGTSAKASAAGLVDVEVFGGVVTNIEKLLTPHQKRTLQRSLKKREKQNKALTVKRKSCTGRSTAYAIDDPGSRK